MKRKITRFARGWTIGARSASGLEAAWSRPFRARAPKPALVRWSQARRENGLWRRVVIADSKSEQKFVGAEEGTGQFGPGGDIITSDPGLGEKGEGVFPLHIGDGTIEDAPPEPPEAFLVGVTSFQQIVRQIGGTLADQLGIQQVKGLGRHGGLVPFPGELGGLGKIKDVAEPRRAGLRAGADHG